MKPCGFSLAVSLRRQARSSERTGLVYASRNPRRTLFVRAETGLPTHHTTYEFAKLPLIFGLTGFTGATVYTRFITLAFLPVTLLFRTLPQQLENLELSR